ncbi:anti-sigma factor [Nocardioides sp. CCNWLW239]|uniref:anti-sigma factor n=1 Tax=Nocardioides sp. CCNWLW239 TaxID=3128902 RepID=UPI003019905C
MPQVELRLPAEGAYVSVLRTTTAALAARLDFTLEDIEDLRMAVSEAAAICLECASEGADLHIVFDIGEDTIGVTVTTTCDAEAEIDETSFAWQVLTTLARDVTAVPAGDQLKISLVAGATPLGAAR